MSLVGTRPPTLDEWEKYEPHHRARMSFRPGLTGLWQVSGRSNITDFEEVVKLDTQYIGEWSVKPKALIGILMAIVCIVVFYNILIRNFPEFKGLVSDLKNGGLYRLWDLQRHYSTDYDMSANNFISVICEVLFLLYTMSIITEYYFRNVI